MIDFLLKSTISLTVFLGFYHLVLEREKMHAFNRFYLLFSIIISLTIPFLSFEIIKIIPVVQNIEPLNTVITSSVTPENEIQQNSLPIEENINFFQYVLWTLYGLISFLLLIRFGKNIWKLIAKSKSNPTIKYKNANLVLVDDETLPHTFLNSIFINFDDYNNRNIEEELYTHELVHATQKHTLDILFIEFLKVIFWFNPLFIFYKKAIQLNHEFLADEEIVKTYNNVPFYQNLLLLKSNGNQTIYLASNLNYLVTKKRLLMMTKSTSQKIAVLKKIAIVPILAGLIYFFCIEVVAKEKIIGTYSKNNNSKITDKDKIRDRFYSGVYVKIIDERVNRRDVTLYEKLSLEDKRKYLDFIPEIYIARGVPEELFENLKSKNFKIGIDNRLSNKEELKMYQRKDFSYYSYHIVYKSKKSKRLVQEIQYTLYTKDYFDTNMKNSNVHFKRDTITIGNVSYQTAIKEQTNKYLNPKADTLVWYTPGKDGYNLYLGDMNVNSLDKKKLMSTEKRKEFEWENKKRDFAYEGMTITIIDKKNNINFTKLYKDIDVELKQKYLHTHMFYLKGKKTPTKKLFDDFKNKEKYLIFLDDRKIENTALNMITVNDIYYYAKMVNPPTSPREYLYFIYSKDFYEKTLQGKIHDKFKSNIMKIKIGS